MLRAGLVRLGGLTLAELEYIGGAAPGQVAWHWIQLDLRGAGQELDGGSLVTVWVACPAPLWKARHATLLAIPASMRFSRPRG